MDNRLVIAGEVGQRPQTRHSPAGIPISRFTLRHHSWQSEAGMKRQALFSIGIIASGEALLDAVGKLEAGNWVRVTGFISRANNRQGENRLVLHAERIEPIET